MICAEFGRNLSLKDLQNSANYTGRFRGICLTSILL